MFIDRRILDDSINHSILVDPSNTSNHYAILTQIPFDVSYNLESVAYQKPAVVKQFRWDKGDLSLYYALTGELLNKIKQTFLASLQTCAVGMNYITVTQKYTTMNCYTV